MKAITSVNCFEKKRYPAIQNYLISENLKSSGFTFDQTRKKRQQRVERLKKNQLKSQIPQRDHCGTL